MANYEMYVCLNKATYESAIPSALQSQLGTGTWKEAAFDGKLGVPRESHDGAYIIVKGAFSMLTGEMTAIIALGASQSYPVNSVLTKSEAQTLSNSGTFTGE
tara:strand:+ start:1683 stop:1988 length:306 start_codon:yes stop_codon:yes gene_type:complete